MIVIYKINCMFKNIKIAKRSFVSAIINPTAVVKDQNTHINEIIEYDLNDGGYFLSHARQ